MLLQRWKGMKQVQVPVLCTHLSFRDQTGQNVAFCNSTRTTLFINGAHHTWGDYALRSPICGHPALDPSLFTAAVCQPGTHPSSHHKLDLFHKRPFNILGPNCLIENSYWLTIFYYLSTCFSCCQKGLFADVNIFIFPDTFKDLALGLAFFFFSLIQCSMANSMNVIDTKCTWALAACFLLILSLIEHLHLIVVKCPPQTFCNLNCIPSESTSPPFYAFRNTLPHYKYQWSWKEATSTSPRQHTEIQQIKGKIVMVRLDF